MVKFVFAFAVFLIGAAADEQSQSDPQEHVSAHVSHFDSDGHHNPQYDHETFLGKDEAKTFDHLPPEESKRRLESIVDRIDEDKDGFVTHAELSNSISNTQRIYIDDEVDSVWQHHNLQNNENIGWETYRKEVYGFLDELNHEELEREENSISYSNMLTHRRRWSAADQDSDDALTREEFKAFLHPVHSPVMHDVVLTEIIEEIDKDQDGKISLDEYIAEQYGPPVPDAKEPDWVTREREEFSKVHDSNGDGFLDREEVSAWALPKNHDSVDGESKHLISGADQNGDGKLTKMEILENYDLFVGSTITNFGEEMVHHDEF